MRARNVFIGVALLFGLAPLARADIVLLTNGRFVKAPSYTVTEGEVLISLADGGRIQLPIHHVERIVDDEIIVLDGTTERPATISGVFPQRSWRFDETRRPLFASGYDPIILAAARKFDVDAALVSAVIKAESDYRPRAVSHKGARGLMQLMPATALRFGVTDSFDPEANIHGGTRYLRWLLGKFEGNADLAVAAYNAGEGNVFKYNGVPPFRETVQYIHRIARHLERFEAQPSSSSNQVVAR
ncbi:MAG TPA: lytic transglycosylase domain-containing protein [Thermoanaerobaculia bacterium]|nr:lytic transglycosylase domain-containing protein [Thermoanaerobaculia bacterium]